jgi:drug/metabolite transporter (DMT)-like permease
MKSWSILIVLALVWGSSYILMKKALVVFEPMELAGLRILISSFFFLPFFIKNFKKIVWQNWKYYLIVGLLGSGFPALLFAFAQTKLNSSLTGILSSLTPLFTLITGILFFSKSINRNQVIGVIVGLSGALLLMALGNEQAQFDLQTLGFTALVVLACLFYALSSNTVGSKLPNKSSFDISTSAFTFLLPLGIAILCNEQVWIPLKQSNGLEGLAYVGVLSLGGTVAASVLFFHLVQIRDAVFASMVSYLIPIVALMWGFLDGEKISLIHAAGMTLILFGVFLTRKKKKQLEAA